MSRVYLYAIVPAAERGQFDAAGVWPGEPQVRDIRGDALAAVVGAAPPIDFRALSREDAVHYLLAHQRVVESVMRTSAALPVKFGTTLSNEAAVAGMLGTRRDDIGTIARGDFAACADRAYRLMEH